jgi:hypothetical protein
VSSDGGISPQRRRGRGMSLPAKRHLRQHGRQLLSVDGDISVQKSVATRSLPSARSSIRVTRGQARPCNTTWGPACAGAPRELAGIPQALRRLRTKPGFDG